MKVSNFRYYYLIIITLLAAFLLESFYLPADFAPYRPQWVLLVLCYWVLTYPFRINVGLAWLTGILMDIFTGTLMGSHALAFTLVTYILLKLQHHLRFFTLWQQTLVVFMMTVLYQIILSWAHGMQNQLSLSLEMAYPIITSTLLWPFLALCLRRSRRHLKLA
jgi:rod shape-determining protein MreD